MKKYKTKIIELRKLGKSYSEIVDILGCSKGTVSYHCGENQVKKTNLRNKKNRELNPLSKKLGNFKSRKGVKSLENRIDHFQRAPNFSKKRTFSFGMADILNKYRDNPRCYLTGRIIDLNNPDSYSFDHIIPASKGGENTLENLGLTCSDANKMKSDLTINELFQLCVDILTNHKYQVLAPTAGAAPA